jgi:hypothetical protein
VKLSDEGGISENDCIKAISFDGVEIVGLVVKMPCAIAASLAEDGADEAEKEEGE